MRTDTRDWELTCAITSAKNFESTDWLTTTRTSVYQTEVVRLVRLGSPVADLIQAARVPSFEHDEQLRQTAAGDAQDIIDQIRALLLRYEGGARGPDEE